MTYVRTYGARRVIPLAPPVNASTVTLGHAGSSRCRSGGVLKEAGVKTVLVATVLFTAGIFAALSVDAQVVRQTRDVPVDDRGGVERSAEPVWPAVAAIQVRHAIKLAPPVVNCVPGDGGIPCDRDYPPDPDSGGGDVWGGCQINSVCHLSLPGCAGAPYAKCQNNHRADGGGQPCRAC